MSEILVVGSVASDTIHNPQGSHPKLLGGAAVYASLAAAPFCSVRLVGVVGQAYPDSAIQTLRAHKIDLQGLEVAKGQTFHWEGRYSADLCTRETLKTELNVFADFHPKIPKSFAATPYVMLANIDPSLQIEVLDQLDSPKLVIADTMNFWIDQKLDTLKALLKRVHVLVINEEEARQLSNKIHPLAMIEALQALGPRIVIVKRGEYGALLGAESEVFSAPGYPLRHVNDPTGAGDSFAGGMLGHLASEESQAHAAMRRGIIAGSAIASLCVESLGIEGLVGLKRETVDSRIQEFAQLVRF